MKKQGKKNIRRILALCVTIAILCALLPVGISSALTGFTVTIDPAIGGTIGATLTNVADPQGDIHTTQFVGGTATFTGDVDVASSYWLSITGMEGHMDISKLLLPSDIIAGTYDGTSLLVVRPTIDVLGKMPEEDWTNGTSVAVSGEASTASGTVTTVHYSTTEAHYDSDGGTSIGAAADGSFSFNISSLTTTNDLYYVWAYNDDGGKSLPSTIRVSIDRDAPEIDDIIVKKKDDSTSAETINERIFGAFFNEILEVVVEADDADSGVETITLEYDDSGGWEPLAPAATSSPATFELPVDAVMYKIRVTVTDAAGNSVTKTPVDLGALTTNDVMLEDVEPEVSLAFVPSLSPDYTAISDGKRWYGSASAFNFEATAQDRDSGLASVTATINGNDVSPALNATFTGGTPEKGLQNYNTGYSTGVLAEGENVLILTATDNAHNKGVLTEKLYVDTIAPTVTKFEITAADGTPLNPLSFLSYGTFFNGRVRVTVTADDADGSGVKSVELFHGVDSWGTATPVDGKAEFYIPAAVAAGSVLFDDTLSATATDYLDNTSAAKSPMQGNPALLNNNLMIETVKPTAAITVPTPVYTDGGGRDWFSGPTTFSVAVSDIDSGIRSVEVKLNGQTIRNDSFYQSPKFAESFVIDTNQGVGAADGAYTLAVKVTDNAGNVEEKERTVYIDTKEPVVTGFEFEAAGVVQDLNRRDVSMDQTDYGYYFKEETRVTIIAQDRVPGSGVRSITYYTVDINGVKSAETTVMTTDKASFVLPANFKGQVFAKAADQVGYVQSGFVSPNSVIVESPGQHMEEPHIRFRKADTPYTDNTGLKLYTGDTTVGLTVTDTFSGLRRVEWAITAPYDTARNSRGSIDIAGKTVTGDTDGWDVTKTEKNLITEMTGEVTARNNSNGITVWVKITDRSGNTTEEYITFSIDKTAPTISVTYNNNNQDRDFPGYYKADRTATIVVAERNFRPEDVHISITNTDGAIPAVSGWTTVWNAADPDKTTHTATVRYTADGDYTFDIRYSDNAGNAAAPFGQHAFTIDKTMPRIEVSYDNNEPVNGQYYPASRTATIRITEHNFETGRIQITGTATDGGAPAGFPAASSWSSSGDVHTATILYDDDARYTFTIAYTDKAGNAAAGFETHEFVVDQTAPAVEITGVADQSANNGEVIPVVSFSDTNYDPDKASISLSGAARNAVPLIGGFADRHNGQVYTFDDFEYEKEIDDIYTLTAALSDLAGNETSQTITFSVNRFGSVYVFDASLQEIGGKYIQNEVDVVVTETNVDSLQRNTVNIKTVYNGVPKDLEAEQDYSVEYTGGDGTWSQYQYTIPKDLFVGEGSYVVTLYSVDAAGNVNENIRESKEAEISFGIDKTPPVIVPIDLEGGRQYAVDTLEATVSVADNLILRDVAIYLNDEKIEAQAIENQTFVIPASNTKQSVRIVAVDAAGNESTLEITDFLVTTSLFYRWFNNTPLFAGTLAGVGLLVFLIVLGIKKVKARGRV